MSFRFELWPVEMKERYLASVRAMSRDGSIEAASLETVRVMVESVDLAGRPAGEVDRFLSAVLTEAGLVVRESPPPQPAPPDDATADHSSPAPVAQVSASPATPRRGEATGDATASPPSGGGHVWHLRRVTGVPTEFESIVDTPRTGHVLRYSGSPAQVSSVRGWDGAAAAVSGQLVLTSRGELWRHVDPVGYLGHGLLRERARAIRSSSRLSAYLRDASTVDMVTGPGVLGGRLRLGDRERVVDFAVRQTSLVAVGSNGTVALEYPLTRSGGGGRGTGKILGHHRGGPVRALAFGRVFALLTEDGAVRPFAARSSFSTLLRGANAEVCGSPLTGLPQIIQMTSVGLMLGEDGSLWLLGEDGGVTRCREQDVLRVRDDLALTRAGTLVKVDVPSGSTSPYVTVDPVHVIDFCARGSDGSVLVLTDDPASTTPSAGGAR